MTDEEIEKALYACAYLTAIHCDECPIEQEHKDDCQCESVLVKRTIAYINRLKSENTKLEVAKEKLRKEMAKEFYNLCCGHGTTYIKKFLIQKYCVEVE